MKKKSIIAIVILVSGIACFTALWCTRKRTSENNIPDIQGTQTGEISDYIEETPYRKTRADEKVLPQSIEVSDMDGNVYMIEEFDDNARQMIIGKYGEIGRYPSKIYFIGNDRNKMLLERHVYEYDREGIIKKDFCYIDPNPYDDRNEEKLSSSAEFTCYDGKVAKEIDYLYDSNGKRHATTTFEYSYDENGFLRRTDVYDGSVLSYYEEITCNTNGSPALLRQYTYDGVLMGVKEYTYSGDGNILSYREYSGDKEYMNTESVYQYDSNDYPRKVIVSNYDYFSDSINEETNNPEITYEVYNFIYSEKNQTKLGNLLESE